MNRSPPATRQLAKRLISIEARTNNPSANGTHPVFGGVVEKVRHPLVALTGTAGFRALLARALALTIEEVRWLRGVHVKADGSLQTPADMMKLAPKEFTRGEVVLTAQLLDLLVTFIGEPLTMGLVEEVWPRRTVARRAFKKEKNEKTK